MAKKNEANEGRTHDDEQPRLAAPSKSLTELIAKARARRRPIVPKAKKKTTKKKKSS